MLRNFNQIIKNRKKVIEINKNLLLIKNIDLEKIKNKKGSAITLFFIFILLFASLSIWLYTKISF